MPLPRPNPDTEIVSSELEPQSRDRCNTWPLRVPDENEDNSGDATPPQTHDCNLMHEYIEEEEEETDYFCDGPVDSNELIAPSYAAEPNTPSPSTSDSGISTNGQSQPASKRVANRRNAWGNMSYADLITQAILHSRDQRLTLSQIYDWMVQNVPYFRDKGDSNSSAGWKNSIRHNLSLHSRFMRIQNEGAGKSSWWVINPDAKPGKASRRRAQTMETGSSKALERKRGRVRKKVEQLRAMGINGSALSSGSTETNENGGTSEQQFSDQNAAFRGRSDSTLSNYSTPGGRLSPVDGEYQPYWALAPPLPTVPANAEHVPGELVDMTGNMRLNAVPSKPIVQTNGTAAPVLSSPPSTATYQLPHTRSFSGTPSVSMPPPAPVCRFSSPIKCEPTSTTMSPNVKLEPMESLGVITNGHHHHHHAAVVRTASDTAIPTSYQELHPTTMNRLQNPMLREALQHNGYQSPQTMVNPPPYQGCYQSPGMPHPAASMPVPTTTLPTDLSNNSWLQPMDVQCDIQAVIQHEYKVAGKVDFGKFENL